MSALLKMGCYSAPPPLIVYSFLTCQQRPLSLKSVSRDQSGKDMFSVQVTVAKVVEKMKQRAKNQTTTIKTIYRESLQEINQDSELADAAAILPTLPSLKSSLYRWQCSSFWGAKMTSSQQKPMNSTWMEHFESHHTCSIRFLLSMHSRKYRLKEKRILTIIEKFDSGDYSLNEYINSLSKWMGFKQYCTVAFL